MPNKLQKISTQLPVSSNKESPHFSLLEGAPPRKLQKPLENGDTVIYIGGIPHGFYETEMEGMQQTYAITVVATAYFSQFGKIKRLRIARNKKTVKSKHFGFIEFEAPGVAEIVADCMHNYLLFEHLLQVHVIPPEHVHPKLWRGYNYKRTPLDWGQIERKRQNKERTLDECKKLAENTLKRDRKRRKRIESAGIEYECPEIVGHIQPAPKKIKFDDE
ncbi:RNA-binding (RRM/RBD/RNP motifs) family protein isoform 1 [Tripterygium wilfordii]|uniref:RNA-binding (RRM/RBD/RNP motifs) family protein isoform 1 n=1 Tax=Tripterygium wilfordii TaxID=458696 RepID=A0A7J7D894_TRIWF|nr:RNA-binding (RRM/RBD/RNP motifs) family protein isoform 1 [Tripterygium wilfordii]